MTTDDSIWNSLAMAAGVISPGVLALVILLCVRSWTWRSQYGMKKNKGKRKS